MKMKVRFIYPTALPSPPDGWEVDSVQLVTESSDYAPAPSLEAAVSDYAHYPHSYESEKASLEAMAVPPNWDGNPVDPVNSVWDRIAGEWSPWQ